MIDLPALRTTLGTNPARAGIDPWIAQRIMRHSDYRTTLKHYTVLGLMDKAAAIERLPPIQRETVQHWAGVARCGFREESERRRRSLRNRAM